MSDSIEIMGLAGIAYIRVCAPSNATDEAILDYCNKTSPSGTTNGWTTVVRAKEPEGMAPVTCASDVDRLHLLVGC